MNDFFHHISSAWVCLFFGHYQGLSETLKFLRCLVAEPRRTVGRWACQLCFPAMRVREVAATPGGSIFAIKESYCVNLDVRALCPGRPICRLCATRFWCKLRPPTRPVGSASRRLCPLCGGPVRARRSGVSSWVCLPLLWCSCRRSVPWRHVPVLLELPARRRPYP
jgi:hypothetical protein